MNLSFSNVTSIFCEHHIILESRFTNCKLKNRQQGYGSDLWCLGLWFYQLMVVIPTKVTAWSVNLLMFPQSAARCRDIIAWIGSCQGGSKCDTDRQCRRSRGKVLIRLHSLPREIESKCQYACIQQIQLPKLCHFFLRICYLSRMIFISIVVDNCEHQVMSCIDPLSEPFS